MDKGVKRRVTRIHLLYFASLAEHLKCSEEKLALEPEMATVRHLRDFLAQRGQEWEKLHDPSIKCAINHSIVNEGHALTDQDEVAFFPPVTGG